jgi:catechol 2,3-dioxygenase-like lactoylglutathione lyase family enzyme
MSRWPVSLLRIVLAFVIVFFAAIVSISVNAVLHSHNEWLSGVTFFVAFICLSFFLQRTFPSVYTYGRKWWQRPGRFYEGIFAVALALGVGVLSSKVATLWFGLLAISGVLVALLLRMTGRNHESLDLVPETSSRTEDHIHLPGYTHSPLAPPSQRYKQKEKTSGSRHRWSKPPFYIPDNCAIDVRNLDALRGWYEEKLGLVDANYEREDDSGRPFVDLHPPHSEAFLSLVELPSGASANREHVIFFAKNLEKAHRWLTERGVLVEPITTDSGGNRLFRFRDLEGNTIEVCVEPA